jgi:hypothetical protein
MVVKEKAWINYVLWGKKWKWIRLIDNGGVMMTSIFDKIINIKIISHMSSYYII